MCGADKCFCNHSVSNMVEKQKRVVLGFNEKLEIIKRLRWVETAIFKSIAQTYGVVRITVNDIKHDAEKLNKFLLTVYSVIRHRPGPDDNG